jgi:hypothetical protein
MRWMSGSSFGGAEVARFFGFAAWRAPLFGPLAFAIAG